MLWKRRVSEVIKGISLHLVEIQPIFHLSYGILVRKSKQRWELYSNKTGTISDMCTCMYTSINCGYNLYVLDLSLDNSSSSSTYDGIKRKDHYIRLFEITVEYLSIDFNSTVYCVDISRYV